MTLLLITLLATAMMAGLSAFISVVHYPLFALVGPDWWAAYHAEHSRRTTWVVVAPMVVELLGSVALVLRPPGDLGTAAPVAGLVLALLAWSVTFAGAVPSHGRLGRGYDRREGLRLERVHHVRSVLWAAHAVLLCTMVAAA